LTPTFNIIYIMRICVYDPRYNSLIKFSDFGQILCIRVKVSDSSLNLKIAGQILWLDSLNSGSIV